MDRRHLQHPGPGSAGGGPPPTASEAVRTAQLPTRGHSVKAVACCPTQWTLSTEILTQCRRPPSQGGPRRQALLAPGSTAEAAEAWRDRRAPTPAAQEGPETHGVRTRQPKKVAPYSPAPGEASSPLSSQLLKGKGLELRRGCLRTRKGRTSSIHRHQQWVASQGCRKHPRAAGGHRTPRRGTPWSGPRHSREPAETGHGTLWGRAHGGAHGKTGCGPARPGLPGCLGQGRQTWPRARVSES